MYSPANGPTFRPYENFWTGQRGEIWQANVEERERGIKKKFWADIFGDENLSGKKFMAQSFFISIKSLQLFIEQKIHEALHESKELIWQEKKLRA